MQTYAAHITRKDIVRSVERSLKAMKTATTEGQVKGANKDFNFWTKQLDRIDNGLPVQIRKRAAWY